MLKPLKMIMVEYGPLLDVMQQDSNTNKVAKVRNSCMSSFMIDCKLNLVWLDFV
jgi:hypothetical protein